MLALQVPAAMPRLVGRAAQQLVGRGALPACVATAVVARELSTPTARMLEARQVSLPTYAVEAMRQRFAAAEARDAEAREAPDVGGAVRAWRLVARAGVLSAYVAPLALSRLGVEACKAVGYGGAEERWWDYALWSIEGMGPTFIKLCQWASGRPDLFPARATSRFARLHDHVRPHAFAHTERSLAAALGTDWRSRLSLDEAEGELLGSGCIAQVYRGRTVDGSTVAVKVVHPGVRRVVETDMALLRLVGSTMEAVAPRLRFLSVDASVSRFETAMVSQLDLRIEHSNLERLHALFEADETVVVPRPVQNASRDVLVEEFCAGVPVADFAKRTQGAERAKIAEVGARAILNMVLHHNFVHGDLHPGNILVNDRGQLVLLDAGICVEIPESAHEDMVSILKAMLEQRGEDAARLILASDVNRADLGAMDVDREAQFVAGIVAMIHRARYQPIFDSMNEYMSTVCHLACSNRVVLDASFVNVALAIKIMEGLCLSLTPDFPFLEIATPMFLKAQCRRTARDRLSGWTVSKLEAIDREDQAAAR